MLYAPSAETIALPASTPSGRSVRVAGRAAWMTRLRAHRVLLLLIGLWIINAFDLVLTVIAQANGLLVEINPIAARVLPFGYLAIVVYKTALVAIGSAALLSIRRRPIAEVTAAVMLAVYSLVAFQWKLCFELYDLTHSSTIGSADLTAVGGWIDFMPF
jgi:hypothetical protein